MEFENVSEKGLINAVLKLDELHQQGMRYVPLSVGSVGLRRAITTCIIRKDGKVMYAYSANHLLEVLSELYYDGIEVDLERTTEGFRSHGAMNAEVHVITYNAKKAEGTANVSSPAPSEEKDAPQAPESDDSVKDTQLATQQEEDSLSTFLDSLEGSLKQKKDALAEYALSNHNVILKKNKKLDSMIEDLKGELE